MRPAVHKFLCEVSSSPWRLRGQRRRPQAGRPILLLLLLTLPWPPRTSKQKCPQSLTAPSSPVPIAIVALTAERDEDLGRAARICGGSPQPPALQMLTQMLAVAPSSHRMTKHYCIHPRCSYLRVRNEDGFAAPSTGCAFSFTGTRRPTAVQCTMLCADSVACIPVVQHVLC